MEVDLILKKRNCKRNLVWPGDFSNNKVVPTLLAKIVVLHVKTIAVDVRDLGFEFVFK